MARRSNPSRVQRNIKERNRRMHMRDQLRRLSSLLPQTSKLTVPEILSQATNYIKQMQRKEDLLKRKKAQLKGQQTTFNFNSEHDLAGCSKLRAIINMRNSDSVMELNLICGLNKNFMLYEIISVFEEEGAEVIDATYFNAGDKVICIIKSKARTPRIGVDTSKIEEKLKELVL